MAKLFKFSAAIFCKVWILMCSPLSPSSPLGQRVTYLAAVSDWKYYSPSWQPRARVTSRTGRNSLMADFALRSALGNNEQLGAGLSILGSLGLFVPSEPRWSCP